MKIRHINLYCVHLSPFEVGYLINYYSLRNSFIVRKFSNLGSYVMEDSYHVLLIMKRLIWITAVMAAMAWAGTVSAQPLVLGIHPYRPHTELQQMFAPLADFLSQRTGRKVEVRIGESYQSHFNAIVHSQVDLAFIGPALFVQMTQRHDMPNLLARLEVNGHSTFTGKIITRSYN